MHVIAARKKKRTVLVGHLDSFESRHRHLILLAFLLIDPKIVLLITMHVISASYAIVLQDSSPGKILG